MNKLDAIRARAEAATPGPWHDSTDLIEQHVEPYIVWHGPSGGAIAEIDIEGWTGDHHPDADAAFIAAARSDMPLLLAVVEAAAVLIDHSEWCSVGTDPFVAPLRAALAPLLEETSID